MGLFPTAGPEPGAISTTGRSGAGASHRSGGIYYIYCHSHEQLYTIILHYYTDSSPIIISPPLPPLLPNPSPHIRLPSLPHPTPPRHDLLLQILLLVPLRAKQTLPPPPPAETPLASPSRGRPPRRGEWRITNKEKRKKTKNPHHKINPRIRLRDHHRRWAPRGNEHWSAGNGDDPRGPPLPRRTPHRDLPRHRPQSAREPDPRRGRRGRGLCGACDVEEVEACGAGVDGDGDWRWWCGDGVRWRRGKRDC